jgi:hypothetical protein
MKRTKTDTILDTILVLGGAFALLLVAARCAEAAEPLTWQSPCANNATPLFKVVKPDKLEMRCPGVTKPFMTMQGCVGPKAKKVMLDGKTNVQVTCTSWVHYQTNIPLDWVCRPPEPPIPPKDP